MLARLLGLLVAASFFAPSAQAQIVPVIPNSVLFNARLGTDLIEFNNNIALDSTNGLTNPVFKVRVGDMLLFEFSLTGNRPDTVTAYFTGVPVTLSDPNVGGLVTFAPTLGGGSNYRQILTFNTVGTFNGSIQLNALGSNPDYNFTGGPAISEAPTFTYVITAVPEPASWAFMILGFAIVGSTLRSSRRRAALRSAIA